MEVTRDADIDPAPLAGKRVAIIGFGNQGRAQALNLRDSGIDVVVGLREGSPSRPEVQSHGLSIATPEMAAARAQIAMLLAPDEMLPSIYELIEPHLAQGSTLGFSHGLVIHFGLIAPRGDLDVFLLAPKGPGTALRSLYEAGDGMVALWAVAQDATGSAAGTALAYGQAIGCASAGLIASSFEEEAVADLFNENAVVWGGVPEILEAGFDILIEAGVSPEVAYLECVGELKLLADLIEARGIAGMRSAISNTAELGAVLGGPAVIDDSVRQRMRDVLQSVRSGEFAQVLSDEATSGYPQLRLARERARSAAIEKARERVAAIARRP